MEIDRGGGQTRLRQRATAFTTIPMHTPYTHTQHAPVPVRRTRVPTRYTHRFPCASPMQALAFLAGANSIFDGDKLLTTPNNDRNEDQAMFDQLGLRSRPAFMNYPAGNETSREFEAGAAASAGGGCGGGAAQAEAPAAAEAMGGGGGCCGGPKKAAAGSGCC